MDAGAAAPGPTSLGSRWQATMSRLLVLGLWSALALALLLGVVGVVRAGAAGTPPPAAPPPPPAPVAPPGGCAEMAVAAWIAGDAELLGRSGPRDPAVQEATSTFTAAVRRAATPDAWGYVVGARVRARQEDGGWRDAGLHFFTVTMVAGADAGAGGAPVGTGSCQGWRPAAMPMQVPAPTLAPATAAAYPVSLPAGRTALSDTLEAFFAGVLTGAGAIDRYLAPGVTIPAVTPPPYTAVRVEEILAREPIPGDQPGQVPPDGTTARLLVTVAADPAALPLAYPLTVAVRGGRWEVLAVDPLVGVEPWRDAHAGHPTPDQTTSTRRG